MIVTHTHTPDTEGSFVVERVADLASAAINHITNVAKSKPTDKGTQQTSTHTLAHNSLITTTAHKIFTFDNYILLV